MCHRIKFNVDMSKCVWRVDSCLLPNGQRKHPYDTKREAQADIYLRIAESAGGVVDLRPYRCKHCKKWHLTSSVK